MSYFSDGVNRRKRPFFTSIGQQMLKMEEEKRKTTEEVCGQDEGGHAPLWRALKSYTYIYNSITRIKHGLSSANGSISKGRPAQQKSRE